MPSVKEIGLKKHLERWESEKSKKESLERAHREKQEKLARKTAENKSKAKYNRSKKTLRKSRIGKVKVRGSGITLGSFFR